MIKKINTSEQPKKKYTVIKGLNYNEYYRLYRKNNAAKNSEIQSRYYQNHKAEVAARQRKYRLRKQQELTNTSNASNAPNHE